LLEWLDPPFSCGHWNPELVRLAGGVEGLGREGMPSRTLRWDQVIAWQPEVVFIACCGFGVERTMDDVPRLQSVPGWQDLPAVRSGGVYVTDGSQYFSRPGPRLVDSLEILAHALDPEAHPLPLGLPAPARVIDSAAVNPATCIPAEALMRPQPLIAVTDVEASSRWYQHLLGCRSAHGGKEYERLEAKGSLVLQLHSFGVEHHHGPIGDRHDRPYGNGVLLWFEVDDFDAAMTRVADLHAEIVLARHRNPPDGRGGPNHWECWLRDPDGYTVVLASPDGSAGPSSETAGEDA
jgi:catechol 2,3-dioxygenase-like lactoylglutathione lyase family enzyme